MVQLVNFLENIHPDSVILDLLSGVEIHCMIVGCEFVSFEKLDRCLIQLQHYNFM